MPYLTLSYGWILQKSGVSGLSCTVLVTSCFRKALCVTEWATNTRPCAKTSAAMYLRHDNVRQVCLQATALKLSGPTTFNSWPAFSPYLYNGVWSELTCRNSLSHSRLACSRLSAHIQPSVNNPDTNGAANSVVVSKYLQRSWIKLVRPLSAVNKLATLVYSTVYSGLTITSVKIYF